MKPALRALALAATVTVSACATTLTSSYQFAENPLSGAVKERGRTAKLYYQIDTIAVMDAILFDMGARREWVEQEAAAKRLSAGEKTALIEEQEKDYAANVTFFLALYTTDEDWNDLVKKDTRWAVFMDTPGGPVRPVSLESADVEKLPVRDNLYFNPAFRKFYKVKFPKDKAGAPPHTLFVSSQLGEMKFEWGK
ncbi:MAG: hypothetical protein HY751_06370 [Nitrospinae bacterium]|nr:hypothetical protein [Nitrospinota bacterium]